jgi:hypothetical protein
MDEQPQLVPERAATRRLGCMVHRSTVFVEGTIGSAAFAFQAADVSSADLQPRKGLCAAEDLTVEDGVPGIRVHGQPWCTCSLALT